MKITFLFLLFSLSIFSAKARLFSLSATLNGTNVVPANASPAVGTLTGTYDDATKILSWTIPYMNLSSSMTGYGFHIAAVGVNGASFLTSSVSIASPISGSSPPLINTHITALFSGNVYVNIYTTNFPNGEIRGQITIGMEIFNNAVRNDFYGIGGYSHTDGYIPDFGQKSPYVRSGPSPQNDFTYVATTPNGTDLYGSLGRLSTFVFNTAITLTFKGNNIRKLGLKVYEEDFSGTLTSGSINATITTNLNNTATITSTDGARFVGFRVLNQDEYIVSATFSANAGLFTSLDEIMFGDDSPQNVALNFDGVNDYVEIPSNVGNFGTNDNFTVSCWFKPDPSANGEQELIGKWDFSSGTNFAFTIRYNSANGTTYAGQFADPTFSTVGSSTDLRDGKWHHIAFTKNSSVLELVVDGVSAGTGTDNATGVTTNGLPLNIGRRGGSGSKYFKGEIDEVRIWNVGKTAIQIANERFCKTLISANLVAFYNFNNGVPHDNNPLISQVNDASLFESHGTLNNFAKTGDASNFVTGQVKYVKNDATGSNNGSSWANAFTNLQSALTATTCNDLFEVYVAKGNVAYKPSITNNVSESFNIPSGMRIYGGFAGNEKSINQRNMALIRTTNETTLSGDLAGNDILSDFSQNRSENSKTVVNIANKSNVLIDGFSIRGGNRGSDNNDNGGGIKAELSNNCTINQCKLFDNLAFNGGAISVNLTFNLKISNSIFLGNHASQKGDAIYANGLEVSFSFSMHNCVVAGHLGSSTIYTSSFAGISFPTVTHNYNNCIFANNNRAFNNEATAVNNFTLKNSIIYSNTNNNLNSVVNLTIFSAVNQTIINSLVQGETSTANGNLVGTTNPQFVNPVYTNPNNAGDYRLKWCSFAINAGTNTGISPLDLDRKPRNFNTTADMGAYEFLGNMPSQANNSTITGTIDSPTYAGGAIQTITSTAKILAPAGAIDFKAPNAIILNPGFEARGVGKYFKAEIGANSVCVNN